MSIYQALEEGAYKQIEENEGMFKYLTTQFKKDLQRFPDWLISAFCQSYKSFDRDKILTNYFLSQLLTFWVQGDIVYANFNIEGNAFSNKELAKNKKLLICLCYDYFNTDDVTFINGSKIAEKYEELKSHQYIFKDMNIECKSAHIGDGYITINKYIGLYNNKKYVIRVFINLICIN